MHNVTLPVILSLPHGGLAVPPEFADRIEIDATAVYNECDLWVDQLFDLIPPPLARVSMAVARVFVDANRPPDDLDGPDGAIKTVTSYGVPIYRREPSHAEKSLLLDRYWRPFHRQLDQALRDHASEARLILDCHNMAQHGPSAYPGPGNLRPLICLANLGDAAGGPKTERTSCSQTLIQRAAESARRLFADVQLLEPTAGEQAEIVAINRPFAGGYILRRLTGRMPALMVEINRGLFIGDQSATTPVRPPNEERIADIRNRLRHCVEEVIAEAENESRLA